MADYDFDAGEIVTAVNRTSKKVGWRFNGRSFELRPHEEKPLNLVYVLNGIRQNPVMGTYDPTQEHQHQSLIGIKERADTWPIDPIEQTNVVEAIDRSRLPPDRQNAELQRVGWDADDRQLASRANLPSDAGFAGVMPDKG